QDLTPGSWYYISVDSYSGYYGTFTLCLQDAVDYDFYEGAIDVTGIINSCSSDAVYDTRGGSPDKNAGSNWNNSGPKYNRWFKFQAPASGEINITIDIGGAQGSNRRTQLALWESDGVTELSSKRYISTYDDVALGSLDVIPGSWYYISVDSYSGYYGTFTLCLQDVFDGDSDFDGITDSVDVDDDNDGITDYIECKNLLVDSGFNNASGLNYGNNIGVDISPWILGGGDQANIVKVDGAGGYDYQNGGPFEDANILTGDGEDQYYLDIDSGSNDFYQAIVIGNDAKLKYGGYFSSRDGLTGTAQLRIYTGSSGTAGTLVADSGTFSITPTGGDSENTPWKLVEDTVIVTAGTYSFVVTMDNHMNFDEGFASACEDLDADGIYDYLDIDSDNDGIPDNIEGQSTLGYILPSGTVNTSGSYMGLWNNYGTGITPVDTDSDTTEDYKDLDSDNDGKNDIEENGMANAITSIDDDKDGLDNAFETNGTNDASLDVNEDIEDPSDLSILPDEDSDVNSGGDLDYRDLAPVVAYPSSAAVDFDGVDDYLNGNSVLEGLGNITIMAWIKVDAENAEASKTTIVGEDTACRLYMEGGNEVKFSIRTSAGISNSVSAGTINYGEWHHVAGVFSSTAGKQIIYLDGEVITADTNENQIEATIDPSSDWTGDFEVGRKSSSVGDPEYFNGEIDEVRVFNVALTDSQIQTMIYQEIENNSGNVRGSVIPKDIIDFDTKATISWSSLLAYYPMTDIASNQVSDYSQNNNTLTMHNITTVQEQTAPMPYKTTGNGTWSLEGAWQYGSVWDIEGVPSTREWCIVKIESDVTISTSISTYGLIIDSGKTLTINGNNLVKNTGYFELNGTLDLMNDSQLIQTKTSDLVTSADGKTLRRQEGTANPFWYNYWSSPIGTTGVTTLTDNNAATNNPNNTPFRLNMLKDESGFDCQFTSAYTASGNIGTYWLYTFMNGVTYWDWDQLSTTADLSPGIGYTQKGTGNVGADQQYIFQGKPNNGTILVSVTDVGGAGSVADVSKTDYLLGNPYPSALDIHKFIDDNVGVIDGTIQLWQQWSGSSHNLNEYNGGYAQVNKLGATRAYQFVGISGANNGSQDGTLVPSRYLPIGQGFITEIIADGHVEFNNGQRVFILEDDADGTYNNGSVFFKNTKSKSKTASVAAKTTSEEEHPFKKIRLEFSTVTGPDTRRELLLGFSDLTTDGYNYGYDSECDEINNNDLNLNLEGQNMNIKAYGELTPEKVVPLNFKSSGNNSFEIRITDLENIEDTEEIYLKDNLTGTYFDLKPGTPYGFSSEQGKFNERFEIVFQSQQQSLGIEEARHEENFIYYLNKQRRLYAKKLSASVKRLSLISMTGQTVMELQDVSDNALSNGIEIPRISIGTYVACFRTDDNQVFTKKIIVN
ncbi:LamG domain-containing protein, partial [Seonamhaeicola sp.]|uniref:LamG domain-containing protein n=1 Tax=Seonamhaeicola sp. TaxID=1912245 RepID=UPI0026142580